MTTKKHNNDTLTVLPIVATTCEISYNGSNINLVVLSFISFSLSFLSAADTSATDALCLVSFSEKPADNNSQHFHFQQ